MTEKEFKGNLDEFGFPYLIVDLINPLNNKRVNKVKAIIDTGAASTHIKPELIKELGLELKDTTEIKHATDGTVSSGVFNVNIVLNNFFNVPNVRILVLTQPEYPSGMIFGLNILRHCNFNYDSVHKSFSFHLFPTSKIPNR